ncbi:MAG: hypothetical protein JSS75_02455 [Bacteroidetes bacterium]|nr:hypothetical protein [Bacteroidota bacterium]
MMTNKLSKAFATAFILAAGLMVTSLMMVGCKSSTEPTGAQEYDSRAAADVTSAALGTESGGAGVSFGDAMSITKYGTIPTVIDDPKAGTPTSRDTSFDPATKLHTVTITRSASWGRFDFNTVITYTYTFYDASGAPMDNFIKGTTDRIDMTVAKQKSKDIGERVDVQDTAYGTWSITGLTGSTPILNGNFNRSGTDVFHTPENGDRTFTHSFSITFVGDTIVQSTDNGRQHTFLKGPATSHFTAATPKGYTFTRDTKITFNGDGTAVLDVTRTSGDGTVDTYTIDVKVGQWLRFGRK